MGPFVGLAWGVVWFAFWIGMVIVRRQERTRLYDIIEQAMREGRTVPPELLNRVNYPVRRPVSDLRIGVILVAVAAGLFTGGLLNFYTYTGPHPIMFYGPYGLFPIPLFIGVAFLVMAGLKNGGR